MADLHTHTVQAPDVSVGRPIPRACGGKPQTAVLVLSPLLRADARAAVHLAVVPVELVDSFRNVSSRLWSFGDLSPLLPRRTQPGRFALQSRLHDRLEKAAAVRGHASRARLLQVSKTS